MIDLKLQVELLVNDANERPPRSADWTDIGLTTTTMHPGVHGAEPREANSEEQLELTKSSPSQESKLNWQIASTKNGDVAWPLAGPDGDQPSLPIMHRKQGKWSHIQHRYSVTDPTGSSSTVIAAPRHIQQCRGACLLQCCLRNERLSV
mgnify:CR=1 FL=1